MSDDSVIVQVKVRPYGGTYIARCNGKQASCTQSERMAAKAAARKASDVLVSLGTLPATLPNSVLDPIDRGGGIFEVYLGEMLKPKGRKA